MLLHNLNTVLPEAIEDLWSPREDITHLSPREMPVKGLANPNLNPKRADSRTQGEGAGEYLDAESQIFAECRRCVLARVGLDACLHRVREEARWRLVEASLSAFLGQRGCQQRRESPREDNRGATARGACAMNAERGSDTSRLASVAQSMRT